MTKKKNLIDIFSKDDRINSITTDEEEKATRNQLLHEKIEEFNDLTGKNFVDEFLKMNTTFNDQSYFFDYKKWQSFEKNRIYVKST